MAKKEFAILHSKEDLTAILLPTQRKVVPFCSYQNCITFLQNGGQSDNKVFWVPQIG